MNEEETEKSAYNLSGNDIYLLGAYSQRASSNFLRGEMQESFFYAMEMRHIVDYYLNKKDADALDTLEKRIFKVHKLLYKFKLKAEELDEDEDDDERIWQLKIKRLKEMHMKLVQKYRLSVRKCLSKHGFLFKAKEDQTRIT